MLELIDRLKVFCSREHVHHAHEHLALKAGTEEGGECEAVLASTGAMKLSSEHSGHLLL